VLDDGSYEAMIVDVGSAGDDGLQLDITITSGPHTGDVVAVRTQGENADPLSLLGLPVTLVVRDGVPRLVSPPD
jgi:hypothetical protein